MITFYTWNSKITYISLNFCDFILMLKFVDIVTGLETGSASGRNGKSRWERRVIRLWTRLEISVSFRSCFFFFLPHILFFALGVLIAGRWTTGSSRGARRNEDNEMSGINIKLSRKVLPAANLETFWLDNDYNHRHHATKKYRSNKTNEYASGNVRNFAPSTVRRKSCLLSLRLIF